MKKLIKPLFFAVLVASGAAFAGDLQCPAGTKVSTMQNDVDVMVSVCVTPAGVCQGPMRFVFKSTSKVQAEGACQAGMRSGRWVYFDKAGVKTAEIDFKEGNYHGLRVEYHPNGQKSLEERYAEGLLQGSAQRFDAAGKPLPSAGAVRR